ncbi:hypothetical protein DPMN_008105 [Dreissena polymorpha]|uniref:EGF-like domain-containing protein n=1 Tax=Dreissena polymorpha TaxID=45954 RepID=A0A9D4MUR6_DREPO|nr:hypothetical protein DPMN_008105 [Dreissena polymorpha]
MGPIPLLFLIFGLVSLSRGNPQLLLANRKDIRLINITSSGKANVSVILNHLDDALGVDFLYTEGYVFWTDINLEMIKRAVINRTQPTIKGIITTGLVSPDGLACDWIGKKLYWTDAETNRIEVSDLDGNYRKVLYWQNLDQPRAIALDPYHGFIFWTDWGENPKIERAGMDGQPNSRAVIVDENIYWPNGLTIDYEEWRIYWADAKLNYIHTCTFEGRDRRVVAVKTGDDDPTLPHPFAITMLGNDLYWTDWSSKAIHTCDKKTGIEGRRVLTEIQSPMDVIVYDAARQKPGINPCGSNNGGCSHLCLLSPVPLSALQAGHQCACPTGVRLLEDGKTCADGAQQMLLLARRTDIRVISLDMPDFTDIVLQLDNIKHSIAIDFDPVEGYVYWTDDEVRAIRRAYLNGTGQITLIDTEVDHPDGIAVDWIGRNLYWTDTGTDRIEVARLNGTSRKILISDNLDEPRALCLDPEHGYIWWTDWGKEPKIERAFLDGTNRSVIINTDLSWPNGIVVDYREDKIYWCDAKLDLIEVANMDGSGRRVLVRDNLPHLFGFSLLGTNPCGENNGWCSHLCLYTPNGAQCACPGGLELINNGKKCIAPDAFLLFTREEDIKRMSLSISTAHRVTSLPLKDIEKVLSIDFDIGDNRIYWTDGESMSISRAFMNGSSSEKIIDFDIAGPEGMAVDWLAHNIYWADSESNRIQVARLNGTSRRVLIWKDLSHPKAIALDPPNGYMYWTDWAQPPRLERAWLDGSHREVIISDIGRVYGLTIDYSQRRLYWADMDKKTIESSDMNGTNRTRILTLEVLNKPMALTQYQDYLYWTDWETHTIEKANKTSGSNRTMVLEDLDKVMDLLVFHHSRQSGWNNCIKNNGGCSHLCLAMPDAVNLTKQVSCACPTHYTLDNKSCVPPQSFLLFSRKSDISRLLVLEDDSDASPDVILPLTDVNKIRAIDYDPVKEHIYWIGGKSKSIKHAKVDGSEDGVVLNKKDSDGNIRPFDLAIDPFSRVLFYSSAETDSITFVHLELDVSGVVVQGPHYKPRYLAVNPFKGHLYWTSEKSPPTIQRSLLDGTEVISLFHSDLSKPGPIAVDPNEDLLFWADQEDNVIECSDLSGGNRKVLLNGKTTDKLQTVTGIAVFEQYLYWVDKDKKFIGRMDKKTGSNVTIILGRVPNLTDIHAAMQIDPEFLKAHPCARNNGNCSYICIAKSSQSAQCSCPNDLVLVDERSCAEKTTCKASEFTCTTKSAECVPNNWVCDGTADCTDKSDEKDCPVCEPNFFLCNDKKCIPEVQVCDGIPHCADRGDEAGCCKKESETKCADGNKCYERVGRCDGKQDCEDNSDESGCDNQTSSADTKSVSPYVIVAVVVGVFAIIVVGVLVFACRRKSPEFPYEMHEKIVLKPIHSSEAPNSSVKPKRSKKHERKALISATLSLGSETVYDRNHVTGASSSSSAVTQYPKETLNPPPSPVTDRSVCVGEYSDYKTNSSSVHSYKKHRRRHGHVPPPPTTPCSTDVCEDSEPYFRQQNKFFNFSIPEMAYDSDPYPPPPTPHSNYFSDELTSCPDSPTTERSYFNPYPPPPSPVATSDC